MEEPILSRLGRLDNILKHLEDVRSVNQSPKSSSYASATSSGTLTSDGRPSSYANLSHCRPIDEVMIEVETKGTVIERLVHAEDRILKLCLQLEDEIERENEQTPSSSSAEKNKKMNSTPPKKGLKQLVKSCVAAGRSNKKHK